MHIPEDLALCMAEGGRDLSRRALEGLALEEYRSGYITEPELRRLLPRRTLLRKEPRR